MVMMTPQNEQRKIEQNISFDSSPIDFQLS